MPNQEFVPDPTLRRLYPEAEVGGFTKLDGQIEFYTRVNALVDPTSRVLDFGAGRGQWAVEPMADMAKRLRGLRGRVAEVVGADVDPAVLTNPSLDRAVVTELGKPMPFEDGGFDLVIADYVLEHITPENAPAVADELMRVLAPGGWLAARTPNRRGIIAVSARAIPSRFHSAVLARLQPDRKSEDVFPAHYAMNTRKDLRRLFSPHDVHVYGHASEPTYFGHSPTAWRMAAALDRITPPAFAPTLMIFVQKRRH